MDLEKFSQPIYVTRPILPDVTQVSSDLEEIWESQILTNDGAKLKLLESKLKDYLQVNHISVMSNGTLALMIACKALNLSDEVITTPFTFPATSHALTWCGLTPVFCDIDAKTMNIDADKIESLITERTSAILAVNVYGIPCDFEKIQAIAQKHNLKVIYDSAHAFGAKVNGKAIGNYGDISMFSFHATKLFHSVEGGALVCNDPKLLEKINLYRNFGIKNEETVLLPGFNAKMNEIQAAIGLRVLKEVPDEQERRKVLFNTYQNMLQNLPGVRIVTQDIDKRSFQYFVISIDKNECGFSRDEVYEKFKEYNVFTRKYFYPLCSNYPHYAELSSSDPARLPVANKCVNEVLALPFYGKLLPEEVEKICMILKSFC